MPSTRRAIYTYTVALLIPLLVGLAIGLLDNPSPVHAVDDDWTSDCTDTTVGPLADTFSSSSAIRWEHECEECEVADEGNPQPHYVNILLDTTDVPSCGVQVPTYVSSIYVDFCDSMTASSPSEIIGYVRWYNGANLLAITDLTFFDSTTGYSVIPCSKNKTFPTRVDVTWGTGISNPAVGQAVAGFDILVSCCNL